MLHLRRNARILPTATTRSSGRRKQLHQLHLPSRRWIQLRQQPLRIREASLDEEVVPEEEQGNWNLLNLDSISFLFFFLFLSHTFSSVRFWFCFSSLSACCIPRKLLYLHPLKLALTFYLLTTLPLDHATLCFRSSIIFDELNTTRFLSSPLPFPSCLAFLERS